MLLLDSNIKLTVGNSMSNQPVLYTTPFQIPLVTYSQPAHEEL